MPSSSPYVPSVSQDPQNPPNNMNNAPKSAIHEPIDSRLFIGERPNKSHKPQESDDRKGMLITFQTHYALYCRPEHLRLCTAISTEMSHVFLSEL